KVAKRTLGPLAPAYIGVIGAMAKQKKYHDTAAARILEQNLDNPEQALHEMNQQGVVPPKAFFDALTKGHIHTSQLKRETPLLAERSAERKGAEIGVEYGPEATGLKAGSESVVAGEKTKATEAARQPFAIEREERQAGREAKRYSRNLTERINKEERDAARAKDKMRMEAEKSLDAPLKEKAIKWANEKGEHPLGTDTPRSATAKGFDPVDPNE